MKKFLIVLLVCLVLTGCESNFKDEEIKKIMQENEYIIIDVRTKEEYESGHLVDAINIPYDQLSDDLDKSKVIFVYCRSGNRSNIAFKTLTNLGYTVYDLGSFSKIDLPKESK